MLTHYDRNGNCAVGTPSDDKELTTNIKVHAAECHLSTSDVVIITVIIDLEAFGGCGQFSVVGRPNLPM